jgi:hypothetical protein
MYSNANLHNRSFILLKRKAFAESATRKYQLTYVIRDEESMDTLDERIAAKCRTHLRRFDRLRYL